MARTSQNTAAMLTRVRRIKGQVEGIERALDEEWECERVLQIVAACRGALNALMAELVESHVYSHVLIVAECTPPSQREAADQLVAVLKRYFK